MAVETVVRPGEEGKCETVTNRSVGMQRWI